MPLFLVFIKGENMSKKTDNNLDVVDQLVENTFTRLKDIIDANTIIGKTIKLSDTVSIIPISKVSVGMISGGGQMPVKRKDLNSLGNTTGFTITPIVFLTINNTNISYIPTSIEDNSTSKLVETFAMLYDKFLNSNGDSYESEN